MSQNTAVSIQPTESLDPTIVLDQSQFGRPPALDTVLTIPATDVNGVATSKVIFQSGSKTSGHKKHRSKSGHDGQKGKSKNNHQPAKVSNEHLVSCAMIVILLCTTLLFAALFLVQLANSNQVRSFHVWSFFLNVLNYGMDSCRRQPPPPPNHHRPHRHHASPHSWSSRARKTTQRSNTRPKS